MIDFQTIILAGGQSTRMHGDRPKALAKIAGKPIIDHLITSLAGQGLNSISVALGEIQKPFVDHFEMSVQHPEANPSFGRYPLNGASVELRLLDTGNGCETGGRLGRMANLLQKPFVLCWCDALWDVEVNALRLQHSKIKPLVTLLAVHPPGRFGRLQLKNSMVTNFVEKPIVEEEWVNGGLFIVEPGMLEYVTGDDCSLERDVFPTLAQTGQLAAFRHEGLWHCVDTPADQAVLDRLVRDGMLA